MLLLSFSLSLILNSCANPPDFPICIELNPTKGFCTYTISDKDIYVDDLNKLNGKTWWEARPTMVLIPAESYAKLKAYIIKSCKQNNQCGEIKNWERKINRLDSKGK